MYVWNVSYVFSPSSTCTLFSDKRDFSSIPEHTVSFETFQGVCEYLEMTLVSEIRDEIVRRDISRDDIQRFVNAYIRFFIMRTLREMTPDLGEGNLVLEPEEMASCDVESFDIDVCRAKAVASAIAHAYVMCTSRPCYRISYVKLGK